MSGFAYPQPRLPVGAEHGGLTKRELFALHVDQPGVAEIVTAAGLYSPDGYSVWRDSETKIGTFNVWWSQLTNEKRFALAAKVRVQQADTLLAELAKDGVR